ncbi:MAG: putative esterase [Gemmatimonadetes bacterium]|nr:putative esterase [Gemmatimonadota bacterium]
MSDLTDLTLPPDQAAPGGASLKVWRKVRSPELHNYRDVLVALPPSYGDGTRDYPVVYMHDGQNLFDPATSYAGDWDLLATLRATAAAGQEAVVVGIANTGRFRRYEYSPFRDPRHGGGDGDRYLAFVAETVRPMVEAAVRVRRGAEHTAMAGSSLGGLISLYALYRYPGVFGSVAALSPSVWFADGAMLDLAEQSGPPRGRLYLDAGTAESEVLLDGVRRFRDLLETGGMPPERLRYLEDVGAEDHVSHWGRRFRGAWPFLLGAESNDDENRHHRGAGVVLAPGLHRGSQPPE